MYVEAGDSYREAIDKIKAQYPNTTKDKGHNKTINEIIPHENNIDNKGFVDYELNIRN